MPVKNFDNGSMFGHDMDKRLRLTFLGHPVCIIRRRSVTEH